MALSRRKLLYTEEYAAETKKVIAKLSNKVSSLRKSLSAKTASLNKLSTPLSVICAIALPLGFTLGLTLGHKAIPETLMTIFILLGIIICLVAIADCVLIITKKSKGKQLSDRLKSISRDMERVESMAEGLIPGKFNNSTDTHLTAGSPVTNELNKLSSDIEHYSGRPSAWEVFLSVIFFIVSPILAVCVSIVLNKVLNHTLSEGFIGVLLALNPFVSILANVAGCIYLWIRQGKRTTPLVMLALLAMPIVYLLMLFVMPAGFVVLIIVGVVSFCGGNTRNQSCDPGRGECCEGGCEECCERCCEGCCDWCACR